MEDMIDNSASNYQYASLELFNILYSDLEESCIDARFTVWSWPDKASIHINTNDINIMPELLQPKLDTHHIYFGLGLRHPNLNKWQAGTNDDVIATPGFASDIDVAGDGHAKSALPTTTEEALDFAHHCFPELPPSLVVHSGGGIYPFWLFKELWQFEHTEDRNKAQSLLEAFGRTLIQQGTVRGWNFDNVFSLRHVFRLPGTWNLKDPESPKPVQILEYAPGNRCNPDDLEEYILDIQDERQFTQVPGNATVYTDPDLPPADYEKIREQCAWIQYCEQSAQTLDEPNWYAYLSIIARCEDAEHLAHKYSCQYPEYSLEETRNKLQQASERAGPATCIRIKSELCPKICCGCEHDIKSPIVIGRGPSSEEVSQPKKGKKTQAEILVELAIEEVELFQLLQEDAVYAKFTVSSTQ